MNSTVRALKKRLLLTALLIPLLVNLAMVNTVGGSSKTTMSIEPSVIFNLGYGPGTEFTVEIVINEIERLWAFQFELGEAGIIPGYDPTVLELIDFGIPGYVPGQPGGGFLGSRGGKIAWYPGTVDNTEGYLTLSVASLDPKTKLPSKPPQTEDVLATLTFRVVGWGWSPIHFGLDSAFLNESTPAGFEFDPYRNPCRGTIDPDFLNDGFFSNVQGPELYLRRAGAHGGGVWPEWQVGFYGTEQTLYSRITNQGEQGAWVKVKFTVVGCEGQGTEEIMSNEAWLREKLPHPIGPGVVTVSATFEPPATGHYYVSGYLYFKVEDMNDYAPYEMVVDSGGEGEALSRDIAEHYKVVTPPP